MRFARVFPILLFWMATAVFALAGTKVRLATPLGNIDLELYDAERPITTANFLFYVNSGRYVNSFSHRLIPGFAIQAGGFRLGGTAEQPWIEAVPTEAPIVNEFNGDPRFSNRKGTITMAKVEENPDSATSQWFLNLQDNNTGTAQQGNLDLQNGGFTVFGRVIAGLEVLELFNSSFNAAETGGRGVYDKTVAFGPERSNLRLQNLPLLSSQLQSSDLIFTGISVLPEPTPEPTPAPTPAPPPTVEISVKKKITTRKESVAVVGTATAGVSAIQLRLGKKARPVVLGVRGAWKFRVFGLQLGNNDVYVRPVSAAGNLGPSRRVRILRR